MPLFIHKPELISGEEISSGLTNLSEGEQLMPLLFHSASSSPTPEEIWATTFHELSQRIRRSFGQLGSHLRAVAFAYWTFALANPGYYLVMFGGAIPHYQPSVTSIHTTATAFEIIIQIPRHAQ